MNNLLLILLVLESAFIFYNFKSEFHSSVENTPEIPTFSVPQTNSPHTSIPTPTLFLPKFTNQQVPFTSQAPFGEWDDPRHQDGCEEASSLMAIKWALGQEIDSAQSAKDQIIAAVEYQTQNFGEFRDTSVRDTVDRIIKGHFQYNNAEAFSGVSLAEIKEQLFQGHIIIVPANGKKLNNPNFSSGGPDRHMLLIKGYDPNTQEFITNDPGTRQGADYRYDQNVLYSAIRDYPTGSHVSIVGEQKNIIVVSKP